VLTRAQAESVGTYLLKVFPVPVGSASNRTRAHGQMASEALEALGYAEETSWGCVLHETPLKPAVMPRWDDVSVVVLLAAAQSGRVRLAGYHTPDVRTGPGTADPMTLAALQGLWLVEEGRWNAAAKGVL